MYSNACLNYTLDGTSLEMSEQEKDLGVWTHKTLNWDKQIKASISKANKMICWVVRNLIARDRTVMLAIYKALIRPHLEYCVQLWNPTAAHGSWGIILELEGVQRRFTRLIDGIGTLPYSSRLENLKLTTLAERRVRGDLIETFKIISGLVEYGSDLFNVSRSGSNIVSKVKCGVETTKLRNLRKSFLPERVIYYWNALPVDVKNSFSVSSFKVNLECFKTDCIKNGMSYDYHYWKVSEDIISKIESGNYLENKERQNNYLWFHPFSAKKKFINLN